MIDHPLLKKAQRVILSCKTHEQLNVAREFAILAVKQVSQKMRFSKHLHIAEEFLFLIYDKKSSL